MMLNVYIVDSKSHAAEPEQYSGRDASQEDNVSEDCHIADRSSSRAIPVCDLKTNFDTKFHITLDY